MPGMGRMVELCGASPAERSGNFPKGSKMIKKNQGESRRCTIINNNSIVYLYILSHIPALRHLGNLATVDHSSTPFLNLTFLNYLLAI